MSERKVGRLFFFATLQLDDQGVRIAEDAVHYRIRSESTKAVGIDKTFLGVHSSRYTNLSTPKTEITLLFLYASHFLAKIYPLDMQKSHFKRVDNQTRVNERTDQAER